MTWTVAIETDGEARDYVVDNEHGRIATLWDGTDYQTAALIAAAPDLLHALRLMLREHDALQLAKGSTEDRWTAATIARAAINKAEGRT